jgi:broad specificity phosphatase PhoE
MPATKIMVIRHAERPPDDGSIDGVGLSGSKDPEDLIVKGWARAGALVRFFAPADGHFANPLLATPDIIFASKVAHHSPSQRPQHTVMLLADFLHKPVVQTHLKGEENALVVDAMATNGTVLISWERELIPEVGNLIVGNNTTCPQKWHRDRFDLVWIFNRPSGTAQWTFTQVPQLLLPGDSSEALSDR